MPLAGEMVPLLSVLSSGSSGSVSWVELDGDSEPELVIINAGQASAYTNTGAPEWSTSVQGVAAIAPPIDVDHNGRPEIPYLGLASGIGVFSGLSGDLLWSLPSSEFGPIGRVLVHDFNGDGSPELVAVETDCGGGHRNRGRGIGLSLQDPSNPVELFRLAEGLRDYHCSYGTYLADVDGDGRVELVAAGSKFIYVYSTVDGQLLEASSDLGWIPYGNARLFPVQADSDPAEEILLATNNSQSASINSRKLQLIDRLPSGQLGVLWEESVANVSADQHAWPSQPVFDFDGDGQLEVLHAFYDHQSSSWTSYLRALATGGVLWSTPGKAVATWTLDGTPVAIVSRNDALEVLEAGLNGEPLVKAVWPGDELATCPAGYGHDGVATQRLAHDENADVLLLLDTVDEQGFVLSERTLLAINSAGNVLATRNSEGGNHAFHCGDAGLLVAEVSVDGRLAVLDALLSPQPMTHQVVLPDSSGAEFLATAAGEGYLGRGRTLYSLRDANLAHPVSPKRLAHSLLGLADTNSDGEPEWIVMDGQYQANIADLAAIDLAGDHLRWSIDGLVASSALRERVYYRTQLAEDLNADGVSDILTLIQDYPNDVLELWPRSGADGSALWAAPYVLGKPASGAGAPLGVDSSIGPRVFSFPAGSSFRVHDPLSGELLVNASLSTQMPLAVTSVDSPLIIEGARLGARWRAYGFDGQVVWEQQSLAAANTGRWFGTGAAAVMGEAGAWFLVEGRYIQADFDHNLAVLDGNSGALLHVLNLHEGSVHPPTSWTASTSLRAGVGFDAQPGQPPLYLAPASDGWLYVLDLSADPADPTYPDNVLIDALHVGSNLGDLSASDFDGDGLAEVIVPTMDGEAVVLSIPKLDTVLAVLDTNCSTFADVEQVERSDVFCAAWSFSGQTPDGFVATLLDQETGARIGERVAASGTSARFEGLRLVVGRRYQVEVQAYSGAGRSAKSSRVFVSDGAELVDPMQPPEILLEAQPESFVPVEESSRIVFTLSDPSPLASYALLITDPNGSVVFSESQLLNTGLFERALDWAGDDGAGGPLPLGVYTVTVRADDFSGLWSSE
ncbi:MAG: hypothetical protein RBU37_25720, partial [Myxococcota bacterium]|nr:hypothetical protein [Myxococcota bacterium]